MPEQLSFWPKEPKSALDNYFLAILPDATAATSTVACAREQRHLWHLTGQPLPAARLHVSFHGFGRHRHAPPGLVTALEGIVSQIPFGPFDVAFDTVTSFSGGYGKHAIVLRGGEGTIGLEVLYRMLSTGLRRAGLAQAAPSFTPHMTLLYDATKVPDQTVAAIRWTVREVVLVRSLVGRSQHIHLARWPLRWS